MDKNVGKVQPIQEVATHSLNGVSDEECERLYEGKTHS